MSTDRAGTAGQLKTEVALSWYHHGIIMVSSWYHHGIITVSSWYHHGIIMVLSWYRRGIIKVSSWYHHGIMVNAIRNAGDNPRKLWRIIKQQLGSNKRDSSILEINGLTDPACMANHINDLFVDIGPNLAKSIPDSLIDMNYDC